jgi:hypothetical protein
MENRDSTAGPGMAQAVGLSRAPKEERAIAASFEARVGGSPPLQNRPRTATANARDLEDPLSFKPHLGASTSIRARLPLVSNPHLQQ